MTSKPLRHDGSANLGGPRPDPPVRPSHDHEASTGHEAFDPSYGDRSTVGVYDERRAFEAVHGTPSPRQLAQRGENVVPKAKTAWPEPRMVPAPIE